MTERPKPTKRETELLRAVVSHTAEQAAELRAEMAKRLPRDPEVLLEGIRLHVAEVAAGLRAEIAELRAEVAAFEAKAREASEAKAPPPPPPGRFRFLGR